VPRLLLIVLLLAGSRASAMDPHLEVGVNPFEVSLTPPVSEVGVSRVYSTSGSLTFFVGRRLGFRLMGGASWYSALGLVTVDVAQVHAPVLLPSWWGQGGVVWRFEPLEDLVWLDAHLDAGVVNSILGLSQAQGNLASAALGRQLASSVGLAMHVRLERHIALNLGVRGTLFGLGPPRVAGCSEGDLQSLSAREQQGLDPQGAVVSAGCDAAAFHDLPPGSSGVALEAIKGRGALVSGTLTFEMGFAFF
jgi:hypothetical protein